MSVAMARDVAANQSPSILSPEIHIVQQKKKKSRLIKWDEETIALHDASRGTRMRIIEPPTPYTYLSESELSACESDAEKSISSSGKISNRWGYSNVDNIAMSYLCDDNDDNSLHSPDRSIFIEDGSSVSSFVPSQLSKELRKNRISPKSGFNRKKKMTIDEAYDGNHIMTEKMTTDDTNDCQHILSGKIDADDGNNCDETQMTTDDANESHMTRTGMSFSCPSESVYFQTQPDGRVNHHDLPVRASSSDMNWSHLHAKLNYEQELRDFNGSRNDFLDVVDSSDRCTTNNDIGSSNLIIDGVSQLSISPNISVSDFTKKRAAHYDEFKIIQAMRSKAHMDDDEEDNVGV